jgi:hypothetical protein
MEEDEEAQGADDQALAEAPAESQREIERGPSQPIAQLRNPRETVEDPEVPSGADSSRGPPAATPGPEPLVPVVPVPLIDEEESDEDIEEIPIPKVAPTIPRWRAAGLTRPPNPSQGTALKGPQSRSLLPGAPSSLLPGGVQPPVPKGKPKPKPPAKPPAKSPFELLPRTTATPDDPGAGSSSALAPPARAPPSPAKAAPQPAAGKPTAPRTGLPRGPPAHGTQLPLPSPQPASPGARGPAPAAQPKPPAASDASVQRDLQQRLDRHSKQ